MSGLDEASLTDAQPEIELYQLNEDGEEIPVVGVGGVNGVAEKASDTILALSLFRQV
ncbi:MAG UNVERIFIED_CONTAM: hypothetical protein LVR18_49985 [Planctomycetaceae bacterium]